MGRKKIISDLTVAFLFILTIIFIGCSSKDTNEWLKNLPQPWTLDEDQVSEILPKFDKRFPDFNQRLKAINLWRGGTPYGIFKLGEEIADFQYIADTIEYPASTNHYDQVPKEVPVYGR